MEQMGNCQMMTKLKKEPFLCLNWQKNRFGTGQKPEKVKGMQRKEEEMWKHKKKIFL